MSLMFQLGTKYTRDYIASIAGGDPVPYLPQDPTGRVVAGCYRPDLNPDVPDIVLPGTGSQIEASAREYRNGRYAIPTFVKLAQNGWLYVGMYIVKDFSDDPKEIARQQVKANLVGRGTKGREKITMVLYLEPVGPHFDLRSERVCP
jgi:hypothetical protein